MGTRVRCRGLVAFAACAAFVVLGSCTSSDDGSTATSAPSTAATVTAPTTGATTSTSPSGETTVDVFFLDQDAFNIGRPPFVLPVERSVPSSAPEQGALEQLFAGPTAQDAAGGLIFVASGATGFADLRIDEGTAHVRLVGGCSSGGSTFTVADEIVATLRQFVGIDAVKIYDPDGGTEEPDQPGDSIPFCLEP